MSIDTIFQKKFWGRLDNLKKTYMCSESVKLDDILAMRPAILHAIDELIKLTMVPISGMHFLVIVKVPFFIFYRYTSYNRVAVSKCVNNTFIAGPTILHPFYTSKTDM